MLAGKVALVTGSGRGLGAAICDVLAEAGMAIAAADIRLDLAEGVAERIMKAGGRAMALRLDVGNDVEAPEAVRRTVERHGRLDALVNNAGTDLTVPVHEMSVADWDRIIGTNLRGPFLMAKSALEVMRQAGSGHVINIASTAAKRAWANASAYHASKWGLVGFSHALHVEARAFNVKVTAIIAGGMRTRFLFDRFPDLDPGVLQDPRNVAETVRFVLSQPDETVVPEVTVIPMRETSWP